MTFWSDGLSARHAAQRNDLRNRSNKMNITVAGVGYVGLAQAVLLAQHNAVTAVTTTPAKAEQINRGISPIADAEIRSRTSCAQSR